MSAVLANWIRTNFRERRRAHGRVVQAHYELASAYLDRIHGEEPKSEGGLFT